MLSGVSTLGDIDDCIEASENPLERAALPKLFCAVEDTGTANSVTPGGAEPIVS